MVTVDLDTTTWAEKACQGAGLIFPPISSLPCFFIYIAAEEAPEMILSRAWPAVGSNRAHHPPASLSFNCCLGAPGNLAFGAGDGLSYLPFVLAILSLFLSLLHD